MLPRRRAKTVKVCEREWQCKVCLKDYFYRGHLQRHLSTEHRYCQKMSQLCCQFCSQIFHNRIAFENHKMLAASEMREAFEETGESKRKLRFLMSALVGFKGYKFCAPYFTPALLAKFRKEGASKLQGRRVIYKARRSRRYRKGLRERKRLERKQQQLVRECQERRSRLGLRVASGWAMSRE